MSGLSKCFDLQVTCAGMSAAALAIELLLRAQSDPQFKVERGGEDDSPEVRFMVVFAKDGKGYGAEFLLEGARLLACFATSPSDWGSRTRAAAFSRAFQPLLTPAFSKSGAQATISSAEDPDSGNA